MWPGVDMNVESELLWPGVALLLLLGTVASLCVRCSRPAVKKSEKIYEQRSPPGVDTFFWGQGGTCGHLWCGVRWMRRASTVGRTRGLCPKGRGEPQRSWEEGGRRVNRTLRWPGPIPWSGKPGLGPWWTWTPTWPQQGRTSCCASPPASRGPDGDPDPAPKQPTQTPFPWTITTGGSSGSPRKMRTTRMPIPTRTCSSARGRSPTQVTRDRRITRTPHPSGSGGSPGGPWSEPRGKSLRPWQAAQTRTTTTTLIT
ncbi:linker for activation of T-cells family member 2 isoform X2 [Mustela lutreola]|uniref:linker for activation of T-cells family member 2 isoform X2 n=1 Tax=Mustela lutreola TaxID=9666 RepID=UPI002796FD37|nr:linker for activation of T-cells family member 2 isoform X2 [Mustela lutreola]